MFKKGAFDEKMDEVFDDIVENNPLMKKAKATIAEAEDEITSSLEKELYGKTGVVSVSKDNKEEMMREWDSMIDQIIDKELGAYKVCPSCGEAVSSKLENCPKCGTKLPEITAAFRICPYCGAKNKALDFNCVNCGKKLELIPEESD
jgi:predicted RNA-binding Zn-ribbon protein involved in translation (DUF1610 family)